VADAERLGQRPKGAALGCGLDEHRAFVGRQPLGTLPIRGAARLPNSASRRRDRRPYVSLGQGASASPIPVASARETPTTQRMRFGRGFIATAVLLSIACLAPLRASFGVAMTIRWLENRVDAGWAPTVAPRAAGVASARHGQWNRRRRNRG
jgi:hypothetical protein